MSVRCPLKSPWEEHPKVKRLKQIIDGKHRSLDIDLFFIFLVCVVSWQEGPLEEENIDQGFDSLASNGSAKYSQFNGIFIQIMN